MSKFVSISPAMLLIVLASFFISLLAPKGMAMEMNQTQPTELSDVSEHCAQMMAEKDNEQKSMDCCDECECSMATCSSLYSLLTIGWTGSNITTNLPTNLVNQLYLEPIQSFFKPPKIS